MANQEGSDIAGPSEGTGDMALIGEGTEREARVSIQTLQGIYHELTGKSEDVSKTYNKPFQISLADLEQLNYRVKQCYEQYQIQTDNCSVKVFYVNDARDTFSSFERFASFNAGTTSAVESVLIEYNFLIILPKTHKPQTYKLSIRIASRVAIEKQFQHDGPFRIRQIIKLMASQTAVVNVKYIDYVVARSILNTVDSWFEGVKTQFVSKPWKYVTRHTHFLPHISRYFVGACVAYLIYANSRTFLPASTDLHQLGVFLLLAFVGLFAAYHLASHLGSAAEASIDNWSPLSYLSLTKGDESLIEETKRRNKRSILFGIIKFVCALLVSVLSGVIVHSLVG